MRYAGRHSASVPRRRSWDQGRLPPTSPPRSIGLMAIARMRRACLASAVRAASARNCEILRSWRIISIADILTAPRINDMLHRACAASSIVIIEGEDHSVLHAAAAEPKHGFGRTVEIAIDVCQGNVVR